MKIILMIVVSFISMNAFAQNENVVNDKYVAISDFSTYGYINGIRLDSVQAVYAQFDFGGSNRIKFDYGQQINKNKDYFITNKEGKWLFIDKQSYSFLLNFFQYNHWELNQAFAQNTYSYWILKKQDGAKP